MGNAEFILLLDTTIFAVYVLYRGMVLRCDVECWCTFGGWV